MIDRILLLACCSGLVLLALISFLLSLEIVPVAGPLFENKIYLLFSVSDERNLWTWANTVLLASAGQTHVIAGWRRWQSRLPGGAAWFATGAILFALSADDAAMIHEQFLGPLGATLGAGRGLTHFHWVLPGAFVALAALIIFALHLRTLRGAAARYAVGGAVSFFGAAVGLEAASGLFLEINAYGPGYVTIYHVEELMEGIGAALLLVAGIADRPRGERDLSMYAQPNAPPP